MDSSWYIKEYNTDVTEHRRVLSKNPRIERPVAYRIMPREQVLLWPCFLRSISDISYLFTPKSNFWVVGTATGPQELSLFLQQNQLLTSDLFELDFGLHPSRSR